MGAINSQTHFNFEPETDMDELSLAIDRLSRSFSEEENVEYYAYPQNNPDNFLVLLATIDNRIIRAHFHRRVTKLEIFNGRMFFIAEDFTRMVSEGYELRGEFAEILVNDFCLETRYRYTQNPIIPSLNNEDSDNNNNNNSTEVRTFAIGVNLLQLDSDTVEFSVQDNLVKLHARKNTDPIRLSIHFIGTVTIDQIQIDTVDNRGYAWINII